MNAPTNLQAKKRDGSWAVNEGDEVVFYCADGFFSGSARECHARVLSVDADRSKAYVDGSPALGLGWLTAAGVFTADQPKGA